ncbi:Bgt-50256, partial [Blumeria graminis f. sp. tritici]
AVPKQPQSGKSGKPGGDRKTKRSEQEESRFADGSFLVVKAPEAIKDKLTEEDFSNVCESAGVIKHGMSVGALSKTHWFLRYDNQAEVDEVVGKVITFPKDLGLKKDERHEIVPYLADGPKSFYLSNAGPFKDLEIQELIEKKFEGQKYWMGKKMLGLIKTPKRLLLFEKSQGLYSFEVGDKAGFLLRFRAINRTKKCGYCGKEHEGGAGSCPLIQPCEPSSDLKNRLVRMPI